MKGYRRIESATTKADGKFELFESKTDLGEPLIVTLNGSVIGWIMDDSETLWNYIEKWGRKYENI